LIDKSIHCEISILNKNFYNLNGQIVLSLLTINMTVEKENNSKEVRRESVDYETEE
jgi:hypothetical protein